MSLAAEVLERVGIRLLPEERVEVAVELVGGLTQELEYGQATLLLTNRRVLRYSTAGHRVNVVSMALRDADGVEVNRAEKNIQWAWIGLVFIAGGVLLGLSSMMWLSKPLSPALMGLALVLIGAVFVLSYIGGMTGEVLLRARQQEIKCRMRPKALDDMAVFVERYYLLKLDY